MQVVADACGTSTLLTHDIALRRMAGEGITLTDTARCPAELAQDISTSEGTQVLQIMTG